MATAMIIDSRCEFFTGDAKPPAGKVFGLPVDAISSGLSKKAERAEREQRRHRSEYHEIGELRKHDLPKGIKQADQQAAHGNADQAATAADDDHSKTEYENLRIGGRIERE